MMFDVFNFLTDPEKALESISGLIKALDSRLSKADIDGAIELIPELNEAIKNIPGHIEAVNTAHEAMKSNVMSIRGLFDGGKKEEAPPVPPPKRGDANRGINRIMNRKI